MAPEPPSLDERMLRERLHRFDVRAIDPAGRQRAAVAVAVTEAGFGADLEDAPVLPRWSAASALLLTRRAIDLRAHAGQWA
ncbi:MAG: CoA pyrophosphatase, partial [Burkholderiaceae bacterium]